MPCGDSCKTVTYLIEARRCSIPLTLIALRPHSNTVSIARLFLRPVRNVGDAKPNAWEHTPALDVWLAVLSAYSPRVEDEKDDGECSSRFNLMASSFGVADIVDKGP